MKVIIAGTRHIKNYDLVKRIIIDSDFNITEIVSGGCKGDMLGIRYACENNISFKLFKISSLEWEKHGKSAGPKRNRLMGDYADALIAIWDGLSIGTKDMISYAKHKNIQYFIRIVDKYKEN